MSVPEKKIDSVYDFTDKGLVELKAWLEPWFLDRGGGAVEWEDVGLGCTDSTDGGVAYSDYVTSFSSLIGYWRLGETGSPWADTNPNGYGPHDLILVGSGVALTPDVTGALPVGQDDGAVQFNYESASTSGGEYIHISQLLFNNIPTITVAAFVKTSASAISRRGDVISNMVQTLVPSDVGWALEVVYPARTIRFARTGVYTTSPGSLVVDRWYHVAATNDGTTSRLYLNGVLVATTADSGTSMGVGSEPLRIGGGFNVSGSWLLGSVDEAAVWSTVLTDAEIAALAEAGGF